MEGTSVADLFAMMESISWTLQSVEYIGDGHAIVSSKTCPAKNKYRLKRIDGSVVPMYIHAVNSMGRSLFKSQNIECRRVDAEGEEVHDRQPDLPAAPIEARLKAAAAAVSAEHACQIGSFPRRP